MQEVAAAVTIRRAHYLAGNGSVQLRPRHLKASQKFSLLTNSPPLLEIVSRDAPAWRNKGGKKKYDSLKKKKYLFTQNKRWALAGVSVEYHVYNELRVLMFINTCDCMCLKFHNKMFLNVNQSNWWCQLIFKAWVYFDIRFFFLKKGFMLWIFFKQLFRISTESAHVHQFCSLNEIFFKNNLSRQYCFAFYFPWLLKTNIKYISMQHISL